MKYFFYDIVPTNVIRFYDYYISEIKKSELNSEFYFGIEHEDGKSFYDVKKHYDFYQDFQCTQFKSISWFVDYFIDNEIDIVFINGQRIADDRVVIAAKKAGVKTYMVQHGMYIPFLKRDINFFMSKLKKTLSYLYYSIDISISVNKTFQLPVKYFCVYLLGRNQVELSIDRTLMNVDKIFVYGEYWKYFHKKQFGYDLESQSIIGTPDLANLAETAKKTQENAICYIAQTLVEDGRLDRREQLVFFKGLVDYVNAQNKKLYIKMHPRGERTLFNYANDNENVEFIYNDFPHCKYYIGHYSTLLVKGMSLNNTKTVIYEYKGHSTPGYFVDCASGVIDDTQLLESAFNSDLVKSSDIKQFFNYNPNFSKKLMQEIKCDFNI